MKTSIAVGGATHANIRGMVEFVQQAERLGVDYVWSAEAWGQDAVTSLAYLAGQTSRIMLGTGIMQISARTPSMTAMTPSRSRSVQWAVRPRFGTTAPGCGRLHGVAFRAPLTRLKETVEIVRMAFGREAALCGDSFIRCRDRGRGQSVAHRSSTRPSDFPGHAGAEGAGIHGRRRTGGWAPHFRPIMLRPISLIYKKERKRLDAA